jgi:hypothetical protein
MNRDINTGDDYCDMLMEELSQTTETDGELLEYCEKQIRPLCNTRFLEYIKGEAENYMLTEDEVIACYKEGTKQMISDALEGLYDKGILNLGIDEEGEVVYSLTEDGKEYVKEIKKTK